MRLHHLRIEAFGPFADPVDVDLDALSAAGLFLLTGPTGAGKTSVLDAVCFALFGDVPGDRATAKRLRCDHAAPSAVPRVTLEATLSGRRFRIERSPAWARPKKRGQGTTPEQARVTVAEHLGGEWVPRSSRIDEAADLLTDVLGLTLTQFTQIALLPQGRFQQFLRARADERHQVLARVFRTERFDHLEAWLREHRRVLGREEQELRLEVDDLSSRVSESAGVPVPEDVVDRARWAAALRSGAEARAQETATALTVARAAEETARAEVMRRRDEQTRWRRWHDALAATADLDARAAEHDDLRARAGHARRAAPVLGWIETHAVAAQEARAADTAYTAALTAATAALAQLDATLQAEDGDPLSAPEEPERRLAEVGRRRQEAVASLDLVARVVRAREQAGTAETERTRAAADAEEARVRAAEAADALACAEARWAWRQRLARWEERGALAERWAGLAADLDRARDQVLTAQDVLVRAKDRLIAVQEARLSGIAAELAGALAVGGCCPVCGSQEHPAPADRSADAPDADAERAARRSVADAEGALLVAQEGVTGIVPRLERLLAGLEHDLAAEATAEEEAPLPPSTPADLRELVAAARLEAQQALADLDDGPDRPAVTPARAEAALEAARLTLRDREERLASADGAARTASAALAALESELAALLGLSPTQRATEHPVDPAAVSAVERAADSTVTDEPALFELADLTSPVAPPLDLPAVPAVLPELPELPELPDLPGLQQRLEAEIGLLGAAEAALTELVRTVGVRGPAHRREEQARAAADRSLAEAGFSDAEQVRAAAIPVDELAGLERELAELDQQRSALAALLTDLSAPGLPQAPPPLGEAEQEHAAAQEEAESARAAHESAHRVAQRLGEHDDALTAVLARYTPVAQRLAAVTHLASFVEGRAADNRDRMRLSAYVLAYRLTQVVAAANERLARMSDRRYHLQHLAERGVGDTRGGLTLAVRDDWSGETRDPATLSGGETFVVSLALALGLADVISDEAGGARLDTLFVDEGFGSLDADTLDDVLDTLDTLRDGGRVVGVVSHVGEMRERITTQLVVHKSRRGSTLSTLL